MKALLLEDEIVDCQRLIRVAVRPDCGGEEIIWLRLPKEADGDCGNAIFAIALLQAMALGEPLSLPLPVSASLFKEIERIQAIFSAWEPKLRVVPVETEVAARVDRERPLQPQRGAAFFTAGVDSFFTVHNRYDDITELLYVRGFDVPLYDDVLWKAAHHNLAAAADRIGKPLQIIETNMREVFDKFLNWRMAHGFALAAVAHLSGAHNVYVSASHTYNQLIPCGSHPLTDPLWSTSATRIVHDGAEYTRIAKIRVLADWPPAMQHLCVCWRSRGNPLNCGRCEKCVRTMVSLAIVTGVRQWQVFPSPLRLEQIRSIEAFSSPSQMFIEENLTAARKCTYPDKALINALIEALRRSRRGWSVGRAWATARRQLSAGMDKLVGNHRGRAIRGRIRVLLSKKRCQDDASSEQA